ncbi:hypothetical protein [Halalkalicoccus ordinarius]|uniref:hypothetical protein n=1 Tax=Halalkalicoccus ordinarius TaxID=3116651 RepID=UPI00300F1BD7
MERIDSDSEVVTIEGGMDEFERTNIKETSNGNKIYFFRIAKRTDLFNIDMKWALDLEEESDEEDTAIEEFAKGYLRTYADHAISTYLDQMNLPPIQGVLMEEFGMTLEQTSNINETRD